ncbi:hypothetical protein GOP47_0024276, partial [Adiantum capillus-veneris]
KRASSSPPSLAFLGLSNTCTQELLLHPVKYSANYSSSPPPPPLPGAYYSSLVSKRLEGAHPEYAQQCCEWVGGRRESKCVCVCVRERERERQKRERVVCNLSDRARESGGRERERERSQKLQETCMGILRDSP